MQVSLHTAPRTKLLRLIEQIYYLADHPLSSSMQTIVDDIIAGKAYQAEKIVEIIISTSIELSASDIHITSAAFATLISYRLDGVLQLRYSLPSVVHQRIISVLKVESAMDIAESKRPQDGRMSFKFLQQDFDMRVSCIPTSKGENIVIRILSSGQEVRSLEDLGYLPEQLKVISRAVQSPNGMILATGPTGSGKSTSLYGLLRKINSMQKNVMTVEDPVEFQMPLVRQVPINVKAGITFSSAIKSFLRQDPDVILVGEIRDDETAQLGTRAAQTGHLVLSTLHTNDATGSIARLRDLNVGNFMLASTLNCVIAQRLMRKLCSFCKQEVNISNDDTSYPSQLRGRSIFVHKGCDRCFGTGYLGRVAVCEVMEIDDITKSMIDSGASPLDLKKHALANGMISLREAAYQLVAKGTTDLEEVDRVVKDDDDQQHLNVPDKVA